MVLPETTPTPETHAATSLELLWQEDATAFAVLRDPDGDLSPAPLDSGPREALMAYLASAGAWTGSGEQLNTRASGLARLLVGSSEYQLV